MADEIIEQTAAAVETQQPSELQQMMDISLNGGIIAAKTQEQGQEGGEGQQQQAAVIEQPVFSFEQLKEKFKYEKPEDVFTEIEALRAFKNAPPSNSVDIEFANEKSEKLFKAWQAGKVDEVFDYINQERKIDKLIGAEVTKDTANDIIKLGMQLKYQIEGLTPEEINYKFNKQYGLPKEPQGDPEDDEFKEKHEVWKEQVADIETSKIIDAKVAKRELEAAKTKLVLPEIEATTDENYNQWQKSLEETKRISEEATQEFKSFTPKVLETKLNFNDEANKISFQFQFEPDSESFNKVIELVTNEEKFAEHFPDRKSFLEAMYFGINKEKVLMEAMKQSKNAAIRAGLPDNTQGGIVKQLPQVQEANELDTMMKISLGTNYANAGRQ